MPLPPETPVRTPPQLLLAIAAGVAVANIYYNQPMLADMARTFGSTPGQVGLVATATQIGYAVGMPIFVPLGDLLPRRPLLIGLFLLQALSLLVAAWAPGLSILIAASALIGITSVVPQVMIPLASDLATPDRAGRTVGTVLSGVLLGILLARTVSGFVSQHYGWRAMYLGAAVVALLFAPILRATLPVIPRKAHTTYGALMRSLVQIVRGTPQLRTIALVAGLFFAAFSAFWTTLIFFVERPPYQFGSQAAGLFGLVGAVGAGVAPIAGRLTDTRSSRFVVRWAALAVLISFIVFAALGQQLWALILGVLLLDAGVQAAQVANQTGVMALHPEARSRVNTFYMLCYFGGGSLGSMLASWVWTLAAWPGVCGLGVFSMLLALLCLRSYASGTNNR